MNKLNIITTNYIKLNMLRLQEKEFLEIVDEGVGIIGYDTNTTIIKKYNQITNHIVNRRNL